MRRFRGQLTAYSFLCLPAYCLLLTAYCPSSFAGTISITTKPFALADNEKVYVVLVVTNRGNEPAHQVRTDAEVLGERFRSEVRTRIGPGESREFHFSKPLDSSLAGNFPLTVLVHFQDANGHPFSALTCTTFSVGKNRTAELVSASDPLSIKDNGLVQFRIQNKSSHARRIKASLVLPREFSSERPETQFSLPAGGNKALSFSIRNLGAVYGASYPVFLIQQYDSDGVNHTAVSNTVVSIIHDGNWFKRTRWHWAGGLVLAGACFIFSVAVVKNEQSG
ncbi:MAG: hypothetical protein PHS17_15045 [Desulfobacterales bacterium]|nr:hypothetical protein [Desulfobacterales bacterium]